MPDNTLQFVRLRADTPELAQLLYSRLPQSLLEQCGSQTGHISVDRLNVLGPGMILHPNAYLYVMVDADHVIHGTLWAEYSWLDDRIHTVLISVDKDWQSRNGATLQQILAQLRKIKAERQLETPIEIMTSRPRVYLRRLAKDNIRASDKTILEID